MTNCVQTNQQNTVGMEEYLKQKAAKENAKRIAWRKRLQAYKEKLAKEKTIEQIADDLAKTVPEIEDLIKLLKNKS